MRNVSLIGFLLLVLAASGAAQTLPQAGNYSGTVKITKKVLGIQTATISQAVAAVTESGKLYVALIPEPTLTPKQSSTVQFETVIDSNGFCVIPPVVRILPNEDLFYEFHAKVQVTGTRFSLSYNDIPDRYFDGNGDTVHRASLVASMPSEHFELQFRRITQPLSNAQVPVVIRRR